MIRACGLVAMMMCAVPALGRDGIEVVVDTAHPGAKIDRHVFGQFAEDLGTGLYGGIWVGRDSPIPNTRGIRNDVVAALRDLHVADVRWPGGCYADEYHWQDGIGPASKRRPQANFNWGGVVESNEFGTEEFMDFVDQIGSEAYISVNVGSGTVKEAADWLQYMTADSATAWGKERAGNGHPAPYRVAMLGLGNESWDCGGHMSAAEYTLHLKEYAKFVHNWNKQQPMQKVAVGGPGGAKTDYTAAVMKTWKDNADGDWSIEGLSLHSYTVGAWPPSWPATQFGEKDYARILQETVKMDELIRTHSAIMDEYDPQKKLSLVIDEWGAWYAANKGSNPSFLQQQNSQRDAVLAALNLNIFSRHADRVRNTNIAQMVNVLQAMILTDGPRMVLTPTYYVFRMYVPFGDATLLPVAYEAGSYRVEEFNLPRVDVIAARTREGKIVLALTNVDAKRPATVEVELRDVSSKRVAGETLSAPRVDSVNTFENPRALAPQGISAALKNGRLTLTVPPASVTVVTTQ
ncbi:MAG: alpha-N-arabinofuranosidase [Steroidobacteraceae bacterium]